MIDVYTANTPNDVRVPVALEEPGAPYRVIRVNLGTLEQKRPDFLRINPNGRIPAIVDGNGPDGVPPSVFESGPSSFIWPTSTTDSCRQTQPRACAPLSTSASRSAA